MLPAYLLYQAMSKKSTKNCSPAAHADVQRAIDKARKRWEFNLIKTGDNHNYVNSNNGIRSAPKGGARRMARNGVGTGGGSIVAPVSAGGMTRNRRTPLHDQIVEEDEVIGVIKGTTGFGSTIFPLQPGLAAVFPWLSQVAALYQRYSFESLVLYYKPLVSGFATAGQMGKVILSTDYDAAAGDLTSYRTAETMDPHADGMPYEAIALTLDPKRLTQGKIGKFVRRGIVPPNTDVKTYDSGNLYISTQGNATTDDIGELRVAYRVRLMNPRLPDAPAALPPNNVVAKFKSDGSQAALAMGVPTVISLLTTLYNPLAISVNAGATVFSLAQGIYRLNAAIRFQPTAAAQALQMWFLANGVQIEDSLLYVNLLVGSNLLDGGIYQTSTVVIVPEAGTDIQLQAYFLGAGGTTCATRSYLTVDVL